MKKAIIAVAVAAAVAAPLAAQAEVKGKLFGFSQIQATSGDGTASSTASNGLKFGLKRVRFGYKLSDGPVYGGLQFDIASSLKTLDVYGGYKFNDAANLKLGKFKTPLNMEFNTSGKKFDFADGQMDGGLVLNRQAGGMLSGKVGGGLSYAAFYGNTGGLAGSGAMLGDDNCWAVRIAYDMGKSLHLEAAMGSDENASSGMKDYDVWDVAAAWNNGPMTVKFEYLSGDNVDGDATREADVWYLHGAYKLNDMVTLKARYYDGESSHGSSKAELSNTWLGADIYLGSNDTNGVLKVNYVLADGDDLGSAVGKKGSNFFVDDAFLVQYQISL